MCEQVFIKVRNMGNSPKQTLSTSISGIPTGFNTKHMRYTDQCTVHYVFTVPD